MGTAAKIEAHAHALGLAIHEISLNDQFRCGQPLVDREPARLLVAFVGSSSLIAVSGCVRQMFDDDGGDIRVPASPRAISVR